MAAVLPEALAGTRSSLRLAVLRDAYRTRRTTVAAVIEEVIARCDAADPTIWISRASPENLLARAAALDESGDATRQPLFGIPFAVKDNIDVVGFPTTAGCPAFAFMPDATAPAVARLIEAGAVLIGKTNLDQFASGLVGTRSPYGMLHNVYDARFIAGGSSSGSAVAVAAGLVSFALGTDTAGSGRVPAAFGSIVGVKPTRGLISTRGVIPACRSLDCVSILTQTVADAGEIFECMAVFDSEDPFARQPAFETVPPLPCAFRFGVPSAADLVFFGDDEYERLFARALERLEALGGRRVEIPFAPFRAAAALLYDGPWVAERLDAIERLLAMEPATILPVIREIIERGRNYSALDVFRGGYELARLRREVEAVMREIDVLVLPTAGTIYRIAEVLADPIRLNSNLGAYTNFVNLLDLAAIAVPAGFRSDGLPFGISLMGPAFSDRRLAALAARLEAAVP